VTESDEMVVTVTFSNDPIPVTPPREYYQYGAPTPALKKPRKRRKKTPLSDTSGRVVIYPEDEPVQDRPSWHGRSDMDNMPAAFDDFDDYRYTDYNY